MGVGGWVGVYEWGWVSMCVGGCMMSGWMGGWVRENMLVVLLLRVV